MTRISAVAMLMLVTLIAILVHHRKQFNQRTTCEGQMKSAVADWRNLVDVKFPAPGLFY